MNDVIRRTLTLAFIVVLTTIASAAGITKYRIVTKKDKHTDFARLKTYVWETGWTSHDELADAQIVAAVDRELAALQFTKGVEGKSDVTVVYTVVRRSDADLKSKARGPNGERPRYPVLTLQVMIRHPETHKELFRARADTPIQLDRQAINETIDDQVARMFEHYPSRKAPKE
jgi:hypothetical protein